MIYINELIEGTFELENKKNIVVIENKKLFIEIVEDLLNQSKIGMGYSKIFEDDTEINFFNNVEVIHDYFTLDFNNKKIKNKILNDLKEVVKNEFNYLKVKEFEHEIQKFMLYLFNEIDYEIELIEDVDLYKIIKALEIGIVESSEIFLEKILNYLELYTQLFDIKLFIFVNLLQYLSLDERKQFYYHCMIKNIKILLFENNENNDKIEEEKYFIIDQDLCCIY